MEGDWDSEGGTKLPPPCQGKNSHGPGEVGRVLGGGGRQAGLGSKSPRKSGFDFITGVESS